jgi:hypothetical protein
MQEGTFHLVLMLGRSPDAFLVGVRPHGKPLGSGASLFRCTPADVPAV